MGVDVGGYVCMLEVGSEGFTCRSHTECVRQVFNRRRQQSEEERAVAQHMVQSNLQAEQEERKRRKKEKVRRAHSTQRPDRYHTGLFIYVLIFFGFWYQEELAAQQLQYKEFLARKRAEEAEREAQMERLIRKFLRYLEVWCFVVLPCCQSVTEINL